IAVLTQRLKRDADDLSERWLLNLAYMTLGEYPEAVPRKWLIPPEVFESEYPMKRFVDVSGQMNANVLGLAGGVALEDFDGDGLLDIITSSWGLRDQLRYLHNAGDGSFSDRTEAAGLSGEVGGLNLSHADYDNDGDADVLVLRGGWLGAAGAFPNSLLRNEGDGTFTDITEAAGLLAFHPSQTAAWADYDGDGWLDVFVGGETLDPADPQPCQLFHNNGDGTFSDRAVELGLANLGFVKGAAWGDYDNDGRPDLYVSRMGAPNLLFRNDGPRTEADGPPWRFGEVSRPAGVREPRLSFPTWFWDYDNDGWLDIFVGAWDAASIGQVAAGYLGLPISNEHPRLYHNERDGTFRDVTAELKLDRALLAMGANFGDIDNDGFLDLYLGTGAPELSTLMPNRMFRNAEGRVFQDVTTAGGFGHLQKGHGIAFGDIDNDGDQDIYAVMGGWYSGDAFQNVLFANPGTPNRHITLRLRGVSSNRSAVGARIELIVATKDGERHIHRTVGTGGSFGSSSLQQEIGLGAAESIVALKVRWPASGKTQVFTDVPLDRVFAIREDSNTLEPISTRPIPLEGGTAQRPSVGAGE
ncbi:MAG: CRTAC1 family protein, partial [Myxococcota bacterium]